MTHIYLAGGSFDVGSTLIVPARTVTILDGTLQGLGDMTLLIVEAGGHLVLDGVHVFGLDLGDMEPESNFGFDLGPEDAQPTEPSRIETRSGGALTCRRSLVSFVKLTTSTGSQVSLVASSITDSNVENAGSVSIQLPTTRGYAVPGGHLLPCPPDPEPDMSDLGSSLPCSGIISFVGPNDLLSSLKRLPMPCMRGYYGNSTAKVSQRDRTCEAICPPGERLRARAQPSTYSMHDAQQSHLPCTLHTTFP